MTNPSYPTPNSLLRTILQEFQLAKTAKSYKDNIDLFKQYLIDEAVIKGKTVVLIIDEAQTFKLPLLELLRQLMNFETNEMKLLQLVLFAQEELRTKLMHPMAKNFRSRIALASTLDKIGQEELRHMIDFRWRVASGNQDHPFLPEAIEALYLYSEGIPREACILADNSLLLAYLKETRTIDRKIVELAAQERIANLGTVKKEVTKEKIGKKAKEEK